MPKASKGFSLAIEYYREEDGRWLADIAALPGVTAYGRTRKQATAAVQALALRLIADRLEHGEAVPGPMNVSFIAAEISSLAFDQDQTGAGSAAPHRLNHQAPERHVAPHTGPVGLAGRVVRVP